jgi:DNA segregation ATPase FtsK/SpoIIIE, S-DNA-T family
LTEEQLEIVAKLTHKMSILGASAKPLPQVTIGPIVSVYRFMPTGSTRVSQIESLATDFAVELGVEDVVVKRLPGDNAVGVFVPNETRTPVKFLDTTKHLWAARDKQYIPLNLGVTQVGEPLIDDLVTLPHLLIAGATGSGKSTLLTTLITSICAVKSKDSVNFVLSDTKGVEFRAFEGVPHLLFPVSYEVEDSVKHLQFIVDEMSERLNKIGNAGFHNITEFNKNNSKHPMPYVVIVIDELADILELKGEKRGERPGQDAVSKLAQKARASGIHLLAATQRPSVNIVSGSIKANFPARISFRLPSEFDSRTVLNTTGAEHLLAQGDMFYVSPNKPGITRAHAPLTSCGDIQGALDMIVRMS